MTVPPTRPDELGTVSTVWSIYQRASHRFLTLAPKPRVQSLRKACVIRLKRKRCSIPDHGAGTVASRRSNVRSKKENFIWQFRGNSCGWIRNWRRVTHMYLGTLVKADLLFDICLCFLIQTAHVVDPRRDGRSFACSFTKGPKSRVAASGPAAPMAYRWTQPFFAVQDRQTVRLIEACNAVASRRRQACRAYLHRT